MNLLTPCKRWQGDHSKDGYARLGGRELHRIVYEREKGPIPKSLTIDHLCRVRDCLNVEHMEPVTKRENERRGLKGELTTHCPQGHLYDEQNTRRNRGKRYCRACNRAAAAAYRQRKKEVPASELNAPGD